MTGSNRLRATEQSKDVKLMKSRVLRIAVVSLCAVATVTYAASWVLVDEDSFGITYVDKSSLQRDGDSATFLIKVNYKDRGLYGTLSTKTEVTINCRRRERISRSMATYDDLDFRGRLTDSWETTDRWKPIPTESTDWKVMLVVCSHSSAI